MAKNKVAVLIELANISSAFNALKKERGMPDAAKIDFNKLVSAVTLGCEVISKSVYFGTKKAADDESYKFRDFLAKNGFEVICKEYKIIDDNGKSKIKANFDVEIAVDVCQHLWRRECDEVILISGDSDFAYLVNRAKELNFNIAVVSSRRTISRELSDLANRVILLDELDLDNIAFIKS